MTAKLDFHVVDMEQTMQESAKTVSYPTNRMVTILIRLFSKPSTTIEKSVWLQTQSKSNLTRISVRFK